MNVNLPCNFIIIRFFHINKLYKNDNNKIKD